VTRITHPYSTEKNPGDMTRMKDSRHRKQKKKGGAWAILGGDPRRTDFQTTGGGMVVAKRTKDEEKGQKSAERNTGTRAQKRRTRRGKLRG